MSYETQTASAEDPTGRGYGQTAAEPYRPLSPLQIFWYSLASLGCGTFYSFNNAVLPLFLERFTHNAIILGLMGSTHSVEGAVIQPIVGTLSDRLRSPLGRRRPFMLLFIPLCTLFMLLTPGAGHLAASSRLPAVVFCIFLFTVFFNIAFDPYQALMPDITPEDQRGRVTSFWTLLGVLGQAGILLLPIDLELKFYLVGVVLLGTVLLTCAFTREPHPDTLSPSRKSHWAEVRDALAGLGTLRQARKGLAVFFLSGVGVGAVLPYLTIFVKRITHCSDQEAQMMFLVLMVSTAVTVLPFGMITDRLGSKAVLLLSLGLIGVAAINGLWVHTLGQVTAILVVAGLGNAAQSAASYPLMTQIVPAEEVGFYTGLQTMALSIAQPFTVLITGMLINHGSYRSIFAVCSISMLLALGVLLTLSRTEAEREVRERNLEQGRHPAEPAPAQAQP